MRPLFVDFPGDAVCYAIEDQFMFGPDVLVAPVIEQGARSRKVYLPPGAWRGAWTDETFEGGQWMDVDAPLDTIPVFVRGERQLPFRDSPANEFAGYAGQAA
jgi:alpha-D-xyloside xylohydrolase